MRPLITAISRRLRDDSGISLVELMVGSLLGAIMLATIGGFLISSMRAGAFAQGQSATLNAARNVMQQIEKEIRGAETLQWCAPIGSCLEVGGQTPLGEFRTVRYTKTTEDLVRQVYSSTSSSWEDGHTVVEHITNDASTPVFSCDTQSTLLRVNVDMRIEPTPRSGPSLQVTTSLRPRNFQSAAICP